MTVGRPRCGAAADASANFDENSPNTRCWLRSRISPKVATSQKTVEPPLPSTISHPSGSPNSDVSPERTLPTRFFTAGWRCDVPRMVSCAATSASICSGRILDGPHPKRPSPGSRSAGITMAVGSMLTAPSMADAPGVATHGSPRCESVVGMAESVWQAGPREAHLRTTCRDRPVRHPGRRRQGQGTPGRRRERDRLRRRRTGLPDARPHRRGGRRGVPRSEEPPVHARRRAARAEGSDRRQDAA